LIFKRKDKASYTDRQLIELSKNNSAHFGVLYERYFDLIYRFVFKRIGGDEDKAGDITQLTFLKAMNSLSKYEDRGFPFSSWLYRIAQNEVNLFFRKNKKIISVEVDENKLNVICIENDLSEINLEELIEAINSLKSEHQDLIELRFFQELSFKEIADIYQITEANAKMRIYRILEKMKHNWTTKS
jgi:RNA polymerase sigma-70 factor, ECF subfamily